MREEEFQQVQFVSSNGQMPVSYEISTDFDEQPVLLSKKQEDEMLYSIKIQDNQNLLDLSCDQETLLVQNYKYRDFIEDRICVVGEPVTIHDGYIITYKLYQIKTKKKHSQQFDSAVQRRFSDFQCLQYNMIENFGGCIIPCLPQKNLWASLDMETENDKKIRRKYLQRYLNKILQHPKLKYSSQLREFLFDNQRNFSEKKGQFTSQNKLEDKVWKLTYNIYNYGSSITKSYLFNHQEKTAQSSRHNPRTKEQNEILHYKSLIENMGSLLQSLRIILKNTIDEEKFVNDLTQLDQQRQNSLDQTDIDDVNIETLEENVFEVKQAKIFDKFEDLVDFVMSCRQSLERWIDLHTETNELKNQEKQLAQIHKNNPRNTKLDIIRSQISKNNKKIKQWTKILLQQLQSNIIYGKSLINQFMEELTYIRSNLYKKYLL